jgi:23S rRNA (adenine(2503)-C(2))-methyltransferase
MAPRKTLSVFRKRTVMSDSSSASGSSVKKKSRVLSPQSLLDASALYARVDELKIKRAHVGHMYYQYTRNSKKKKNQTKGIKIIHHFFFFFFFFFSLSIFRILHNGVRDVSTIENLPKALKHLVATEFQLPTSKLIEAATSGDGSTTKLVIELQDGNRVESVIMRYGAHELKNFPESREKRPAMRDGERAFRSKPRCTLCVSSQVGCAMACTFCATGTMGLLSNLTAGEILEQLWHANQIESIRNVVFMGMGEPLDNYDAVVEAIHGMVDVQRFSLAMAHVCISTVGVVNRLRTLARDAPGVSLALSLHAPNQTLRQQIVPTSKAWPLDKIMSAVDAYLADMAYLHPRAKPPRTMIEYVLIDGVNDSLDNADELGRLLKDRPFHVNVIPYNPTDVPHDYRRPPRHVSDQFCEKVREYGLMTILRQTMGDDVAGACGQLVLDVKKREKAAADAAAAASSSSCASSSTATTTTNNSNNVTVVAGADIEDIVPNVRRRAPQPAKKGANAGAAQVAPAAPVSPLTMLAVVVGVVLAFVIVRIVVQQLKAIYV